MTPKRILLLAAIGLLAAALAGVGRPEQARSAEAEAERGITVNGTGAVEAVPDRATFTFGVETQAATARAALAANNREVAAMIAALKSAGVDSKEIQTQQVTLMPRTGEDGRSIVGYTATNSVSATVALERAGAVVDAAVEAGANQVFGPTLARSDRNALYRQALAAAVANAKAKADALAKATGLTVGRVVSVQESGSGPVPVAEAGRAQDVAASVPIEPGTQRIEASVVVTYAAS